MPGILQFSGYVGILSLVEAEATAALGPILVGYVGVRSDGEAVARAATNLLQGQALIESRFDVTLSRRLPFQAAIVLRTDFEALIYTSLITLTLEGESVLTIKGTLMCRQHGMMLNRIATQVYNLWGIEVKTATGITFARARVIEIINTAMQIVYSAAKAVDYFARATDTLTFTAASSSMPLPAGVQHLLGPVRFADSKLPLAPLDTINDFHSYAEIYGVEANSPRVYFLQRANIAGQDNAGLTLHIAPAPTEDTGFEFEYSMQAPRYTESDLLVNARVPMPHAYVESLLLPIVKKIASGDSQFRRDDLRASIDTDYNRARLMLGIVDPEPAPTARNKPRNQEEAKV